MKRSFDEHVGSVNNEIITNNVDAQNSANIYANLTLKQKFDKIQAETTIGEAGNNLPPLIDAINKRIEIKAYILNISKAPQMTDIEKEDAKGYLDNAKKTLYSLVDDYALKTNMIFTLDEAILKNREFGEYNLPYYGILRDKFEYNLPYYAILRDRFDVLKFLFEQKNYNPNWCIKEDDNIGYLHYAAKHSSLDIIKYLVEHHKLDVNGNLDNPVICYAAKNYNPEVIKYFIDEHNIDYQILDVGGTGLLYHALSRLPENIKTFDYFVTNYKFYFYQLMDGSAFAPEFDYTDESYRLILKQVFDAIYNYSIKDEGEGWTNLNTFVDSLLTDAKDQDMLEQVKETIAKIYQSSPLYYSSANDDTKLNNLVEEAFSNSGIDLIGNNYQDVDNLS